MCLTIATGKLAVDQGAAYKSQRFSAKQPFHQPRVDTPPGAVVLASNSGDDYDAIDDETYPRYPAMPRATEALVIEPMDQSDAGDMPMAVAIEDSLAPGRAGFLAPDAEPFYRSNIAKEEDYKSVKYHSLCAPP